MPILWKPSCMQGSKATRSQTSWSARCHLGITVLNPRYEPVFSCSMACACTKSHTYSHVHIRTGCLLELDKPKCFDAQIPQVDAQTPQVEIKTRSMTMTAAQAQIMTCDCCHNHQLRSCASEPLPLVPTYTVQLLQSLLMYR